MKYIIVLSDGMAGRPLEELGGKTTLEAADTPNLTVLQRKQRLDWHLWCRKEWHREVIPPICQ